MNVGLIGAGTIANFLLEQAQSSALFQITCIYVRDERKYIHLKETYGVELYSNFDQFIHANIDFVVEVAHVDAVKQLLPKIIEQKDVAIISVGAFADETFTRKICAKADEFNHRIYLPSGAIGGLDLLQNAHTLGEVRRVSLTTEKPAHSLTTEKLSAKKVMFSGSAQEAIQQFPKNMNVSIILSLAGIGAEATEVTIVADPEASQNKHKIEIEGAFGQASFNVINRAMENNPKTSYLAALSILGTLNRLTKNIHLG